MTCVHIIGVTIRHGSVSNIPAAVTATAEVRSTYNGGARTYNIGSK